MADDPRPGPPEVSGTFVATLPESVRRAVLDAAVVAAYPAGESIFGGPDLQPRFGLILEGIARTYLCAADGRQTTVRYARRGAIVGRRSGLNGDRVPLRVQAVTDACLLELDASTYSRLIGTEVSFSSAVVAQLDRTLEEIYATIGDSVFGTMRQRVARHLLAVSMAGGAGAPLVAAISQQQLADGVGTTREVVARVLAALRFEGVVRTSARQIEIIDAQRLASFLGEWRTAKRRYEADLMFEAQALLDASPNAIVAVDAEGLITYANPSTRPTFGWAPHELVGRAVEMLIPGHLDHKHRGHRAVFQSQAVARPMGLGHELLAMRKDGTAFPVAVSLTPFDTRDGTLVFATVMNLGPHPGEST